MKEPVFQGSDLEAVAKEAYLSSLKEHERRNQEYRKELAHESVARVRKLLGFEAKAEPQMGVAIIGDFHFRRSSSYGKLWAKKSDWDDWEEISGLADLGRLLIEGPIKRPPPREFPPPPEERIAEALEKIAVRLEELVLCFSARNNY